MLNYRLSQKVKLLENDEFNHLTKILTISTPPPPLSFLYLCSFCSVLSSVYVLETRNRTGILDRNSI